MNTVRRGPLSGQRGSVLMEYVILLVFVGATLSLASNKLMYGFNSDTGERMLGPIGRQIQGFYQRTMGGLSLPVP